MLIKIIFVCCIILSLLLCIIQSKVPLNVVIPLYNISQVEKLDSIPNDQSFDNAVIITLKFSNTNDKPPVFIFSHIMERSFFLKKVSELLGKLKT